MDIILIPGFWLDASSWDAVVPALERAGHRVRALTLPGLEARAAPRADIRLRDHVAAVVAAVDAASGPVVLVGHSGGGAIAHAAADARPSRVARVVYVDAFPLPSGQCVNADPPAVDGEVPLPEWSFFEDADLIGLDDDLRAQFRERAIPQPAHVATDLQELSDERRFAVPATIIACQFTPEQLREWMDGGEPVLADLKRMEDVTWVSLPTGHWPQFTRPAELAEVLVTSVGAA
jgi:pimeloyl-ACP methyl ester carboxylesterase